MKIFTSRTARGLMFALLLLGGSVQAVTMADLFRPSTPATSALTLVQHKSFFASHPVLKWGGISVAAAAAAFLAYEGRKAYTQKKNFFSLIKGDVLSILGISKARQVISPEKEELLQVQRNIETTKKQISQKEQELNVAVGYPKYGIESELKGLRNQLADLEKEEKAKRGKISQKNFRTLLSNGVESIMDDMDDEDEQPVVKPSSKNTSKKLESKTSSAAPQQAVTEKAGASTPVAAPTTTSTQKESTSANVDSKKDAPVVKEQPGSTSANSVTPAAATTTTTPVATKA